MRVAVVALVASACVVQASPIYRVVDLGTLGWASAATAVNSLGQTAGWSTLGWGSIHAMGSDGEMGPVSMAGAGQSRASGINDAGQTVGIRYDAYGNALAVVWGPGGEATVLGGPNSYAMGINDSGVVAGAAGGQAVRFTGGGVAEAVGVRTPWSSANAINASGGVAGTAELSSGRFRAFVAPADGRGATILGSLGGGASYGQAINDAGWVAGGSTTVRGYLHAFLYANGRMQDLGTLAGGANSSAYGVNDQGQVVGYTQLSGGDSAAFVWEDGRMRDLNDLIAADTGWRLLEASAVNQAGQIVGFGMLGGVQRAFRLDPIAQEQYKGGQKAFVPASLDISPATAPAPIPEPGTWMLIAVGLAGVAFGVKRRTPGEETGAISEAGADRSGSTPPCR